MTSKSSWSGMIGVIGKVSDRLVCYIYFGFNLAGAARRHGRDAVGIERVLIPMLRVAGSNLYNQPCEFFSLLSCSWHATNSVPQVKFFIVSPRDWLGGAVVSVTLRACLRLGTRGCGFDSRTRVPLIENMGNFLLSWGKASESGARLNSQTIPDGILHSLRRVLPGKTTVYYSCQEGSITE